MSEERAWLIERRFDVGTCAVTYYWAGWVNNIVLWDQNAQNAQRFKTRENAEQMIKHPNAELTDTDQIHEHLWFMS